MNISKEKVRELALKLSFEYGDTRHTEKLITKWLEQNQPEPVVVGLTKPQHYAICQLFAKDPDELNNYVGYLREYMKTQTFPKLEVKKVAVGLSDEQVDKFNELLENQSGISFVDAYLREFLETETFELPNPKKIPVVLTDEQLKSLFGYFPYKATIDEFIEGYQEWAKTQTFAQPQEIDSVAHQHLIDLCDKLEFQLKCAEEKLEQLNPSWDDAPENAVVCQVVKHFLTENHKEAKSEILKIEFRPKPTPVVEVGQVWKHKENRFDLTVTVVQEVADYYYICARYKNAIDDNLQIYWEGSHIEFLSKFEEVN